MRVSSSPSFHFNISGIDKNQNQTHQQVEEEQAKEQKNTIQAPILGNQQDKVLQNLIKQKLNVQEQLQKVKEKEMDPIQKREKIKQLQDQMNEIDQQIQKKQIENLQQKVKKEPDEKQKEKQEQEKVEKEKEDQGNTIADMKHLTKAAVGYSQAQKMNTVKTEFKGKAHVLAIEIEIDGGRDITGNGSAVTGPKQKKLQKIINRIDALEEVVKKKLEETNEEVKVSAKTQEISRKEDQDTKIEKEKQDKQIDPSEEKKEERVKEQNENDISKEKRKDKTIDIRL
jgi:hypothetical protein